MLIFCGVLVKLVLYIVFVVLELFIVMVFLSVIRGFSVSWVASMFE